jgi:segregation and condensation protein A
VVELTLIQGTVGTHVARVHGQPMLELPRDLYIPPEALEVFLETFEGPLDLLLYLIRRHNLDVLDIPMAEITRQYMQYVEAMHVRHLELAAEYLLMAALLIEIKSRMLLPRPPVASGAESDLDPRAELVRRLLEYEQMKQAAGRLNDLPQAGRDFVAVQAHVEITAAVRLPEVDPEDLRQAWLAIIARARANRHHRVTREQLSVREQMIRVLRVLQTAPFAEFRELFSIEGGVAEMVVTFLAILELAKESLVNVTQQAAFAPIYVRLDHGHTAH